MRRMLKPFLACATLLFVAHSHAAPKATPKPAARVKPFQIQAPKTPPGMMIAPFQSGEGTYSGASSALAGMRARKLSNAEVFKPRGRVFLPLGSVNAALHQPVTSSDETPVGASLSVITDGIKNNYEGSFTALKAGTQWVQIDLQDSFNIHGVLLWHFYGEPRVYFDVVVQVSDDVAFTKNVRTVFNNDTNNSSGFDKGRDREFYESSQGKWIPIKSQKARYVRLYSRGNTADLVNHYVEVEVWATPVENSSAKAKPLPLPSPKTILPSRRASQKVVTNLPVELPKVPKTPPSGMMVAPFELPYAPMRSGPTPQTPRTIFKERGPVYLPKGSANVAKGKPVTSSDEAPVIGDLAMVTDGNKVCHDGTWVELGPGTQWVQIDLQHAFTIHGVLVWHFFDAMPIFYDVIVQLADDAAFTKNVRTVYNNDQDNSSGRGVGKDQEYFESHLGGWIPIKAQKAHYVRLYSKGSSSMGLPAGLPNPYIEVEVWATAAK
jgi:hypothetical protein